MVKTENIWNNSDGKTLRSSPRKEKKQEFVKLGARIIHFLKYKKLFKSGVFFELGKLLSEI